MSAEKRKFKRYKVASPVDVLKGAKSFRGRTFDYSLEGIGADIEDHPPLKLGEEVSYRLAGQEADNPGRVVRAEQTESGLKLGIMRTGLLSGSPGYFDLADVFLGLQRSGKTGVFRIVDGAAKKEIFIEGGDMVYAASNLQSDSLGRTLVAAGKITEEQLRRALESAKVAGRRLGAVLVEMHFIDPPALVWAVRRHVESIILGVFGMRRGWFDFSEGPISTDGVIKLRLSTANLIYRGVMGVADPKQVMPFFPPMGSAVRLSSDPLDLFQDISLSEADRQVLKLVDGKRSIDDIVKAAGIPSHRALKLLFVLLSTRVVEVADEPRAPGTEWPTADGLFEGGRETDPELAKKINELYDKLDSLGHYGVLGLGGASSRAEIKRAFYARAREFHPDRHYHLPPEMKDRLHIVFTYITNAYSTLINAGRSTGPSEVRADPAGLALRKFEAGKAALRDMDYPKAARHFGEAVYLDGDNHQYNYFLGAALLRAGRPQEAEAALRHALKSEPFNPQYLAEAGHSYLALGFQLRAKNNFEKALKVDPLNRRAMEGMASLEGEKGA